MNNFESKASGSLSSTELRTLPRVGQALVEAGAISVHQLREALRQQSMGGQRLLLGEVLLLPYANPLGLSQNVLGQHQGRFDLRDGTNFNRGYAERAAAAAAMGPECCVVWMVILVRCVSVRDMRAVERGPFTPGNRRSG
jgi:hypothetical protein